MSQDRPTELRNASKKTGLATRKADPLTFEVFLNEWKRRLGQPRRDWEERRAVTELKRKKLYDTSMYDFVRCTQKSATEWQSTDLIARIADEMKAYRREAEGKRLQELFDHAGHALKRLLSKVENEKVKSGIRELRSVFEKLETEIRGARHQVNWLKERRRDWHFGVWQQLWPEVPRKNLVSRRIELDTRLQIEMGKMFADYLRSPRNERDRVSTETIARLILLAYQVGGLAYEAESGIRVHGTERELTVRNIRDNLNENLVHKAASFRGTRRKRRRIRH